MLAAVKMADVISASYFMRASIEAFAAENIGINMGFELYSKEEWWWRLVGNWQCKVAEIDNVKKLQTNSGRKACKEKKTASELDCNTYRKWPG